MDLKTITLALGIATGSVATLAGAGLWYLHNADRPHSYSDQDRSEMDSLVRRTAFGCGFAPFPPFGCRMVCIDGKWHSVCNRPEQSFQTAIAFE